MKIFFLGNSLEGIGINGFFMEGKTRRGFFPITALIYDDEFRHSDITFLQSKGVNWIPVDCTEEEEEEMKKELSSDEEGIIMRAVNAARERK